jgi:poly-gamma-glutamate system protein
MKKLYWKPTRTSWYIHISIAIISICFIASVETFQVKVKKRNYRDKIKAAKLMKNAMGMIKKYRISNIGPVDPESDPLDSGMVGYLVSSITSNSGDHDAKLATLNPNWAAVMISLFKKASVKKGDTIAIGLSGSFPAFNIAVLSACEVMELKPIVISSASASTWGGNIPELSWLDMEKLLFESRIISNRSVAASMGGGKDRGIGMSKKGRELLKEIISRNGMEYIDEKQEKENLDKRMSIYMEHSDEEMIKAFVNVGGGTISVGTKIGKKLFKSGLNLHPPYKALQIDSVMTRFAKEGVPVIHISGIRKLAEKYKMPFELKSIPRPGDGALFSSFEYNMTLVYISLIVIIGLLVFLVKMGFGSRIFSGRLKKEKGGNEPMV